MDSVPHVKVMETEKSKPASARATKAALSAPLWWAAALVIAAVALLTRVPALWQAEALHDEVLHLQSYRNRYDRPGDMFPMFVKRIEAHPRLSAQRKQQLIDLYDASPLFQRMLFLINDNGSQAYAALAETVRGLFGSNLTALRVPSLLAALAAVVALYYCGKAVGGEATGLLLAALSLSSPLTQAFAGVARQHIFAYLAVAGLFYVAVQERRRDRRSPWRFLLMALATQLAHWAAWLVVGPLVAAELLRRWKRDGLRTLLRQSWWYILITPLLIGVYIVVAMFTAAGKNFGYQGAAKLFGFFSMASPLGSLGRFGDTPLWAGGAGFLALIVVGIVHLLRCEPDRWLRFVILLMLGVSFVAPFLMCHGPRHMLIYIVPQLIVCALGLKAILHRPRLSAAVAIAWAVVTLPLATVWAEDPYKRIFEQETRYSRMAGELSGRLRAQDVWCAVPSFKANCLYQYAALPEPLDAETDLQVIERIESLPAGRSLFLVSYPWIIDAHPVLRGSQARWEFGNQNLLLRYDGR